MTDPVTAHAHFHAASVHLNQAIHMLTDLRTAYEQGMPPGPKRTARIRALDWRLDTLAAVSLDPDAAPWISS